VNVSEPRPDPRAGRALAGSVGPGGSYGLKAVLRRLLAFSPIRLSASAAQRPASQWARLVGFVVLAALAPLVVKGQYQLGLATLVLTYTVVSLGFYLMFCLTGQFAFSQAAMFGIGAYTAAWADRHTGFWFSLLIATVVVTVVAAVFLLLVNRASELYFAIATLGLAQIAILVFQSWTSFAGSGGNASVTGTPSIFGQVIATPTSDFWLALGFTAVALVGVKAIELSPLRRQAIAVRDRERVARGMGVKTLQVRILMFSLGSAFAGAGGALFATTQGFIDPDSFSVSLGIDIFLIVILGGVASMWGCVIGAIFVVALPEVFRPAANYSQLVFAGILLLVIFLLPGGFVSLVDKVRSGLERLRRGSGTGGRSAERTEATPLHDAGVDAAQASAASATQPIPVPSRDATLGRDA
jgi:branched-chain amino acid transport system permease protein